MTYSRIAAPSVTPFVVENGFSMFSVTKDHRKLRHVATYQRHVTLSYRIQSSKHEQRDDTQLNSWTSERGKTPLLDERIHRF